MIAAMDLEEVEDGGVARVPVVDAQDWRRPLPEMDDVAAFYFAAAARGTLLVQQCPACGNRQHYPRYLCVQCGGDPRWLPVAGVGTVHTYSIVRVSGFEGFREEVPYVVAMIDLEAGPRMMANVTDCPVDDVYVGMPVEAYVVRVDDAVGIPFWRPAATA